MQYKMMNFICKIYCLLQKIKLHNQGLLLSNGILDYKKYWEKRYFTGGNSGNGSYGELANFKADFVNKFVKQNNINSVLEFGSGDGNQLSLYKFSSYLGLDVSNTAIEKCKKIYQNDKNKDFLLIYPPRLPLNLERYELVICLEVLMHITDEEEFIWTLDSIFRYSKKFVLLQTPLFEYRNFAEHHHEKYRDLFKYLLPYLGDWHLIDVAVHPSVTFADRKFGKIGDMASDFVVLQRSNIGVPLQ